MELEVIDGLQPGIILVSLIWATLGMILLMVAYKVFDIVNALEFTKEIEKNNQALGTMLGGFFIAIAIIVAAAIHG